MVALAASVDDRADAKVGISPVVPLVLLIPGLLSLVIGALSLLNAVLILRALLRWPWQAVTATYELVETSRGSIGMPVLRLSTADDRWSLRLAVVVWRRHPFHGSDILVAGRRGGAGAVATPDLRAIAWAQRSPLLFLLDGAERWGNRRYDRARSRSMTKRGSRHVSH